MQLDFNQLLSWLPLAIIFIFFLVVFRPAAANKRIKLVTLAVMLVFCGETMQQALGYYKSVLANLSSLNKANYAFPIASVILCFALGILLYHFLVFLRDRLNEQPPVPNARPSIYLLNVVVMSVLGLSLFLVVGVFISIPYLSNLSKTSIYTQSMFDSSLNGLTRDTLRFGAPPPATFPVQLESELNDTALGKNYLTLFNQGSETVQELQKQRLDMIESLNSYIADYRNKEAAAGQQLRAEYIQAIQNITTDKGWATTEALRWMRSFRELARLQYENALQDLQSIDELNARLIQSMKNTIRGEADRLRRTHLLDSVPSLTPVQLKPYYTIAKFNYNGRPVLTAIRDGSDWGIFGMMSGYLIKTGSSELILLIGMFGFGLLGASLSSFEVGDDRNNIIESFRTTPLINNFGSVLARGFGAALIVYLATKAGLAIFSMGGNPTGDANSYMLLLTCFVGALYSEKVWARISNGFGNNDTNGNPPKGQNPQGANPTPGIGGSNASPLATPPAKNDVPEAIDPASISHDFPNTPPAYLTNKAE